MINLPDLTIWTIVWNDDKKWIIRAGQVLRYCKTIINCPRMILFTHDKIADREYPWDTIQIPKLDWQSYNIFVNRAVPAYINTQFAMSVHEDGFPLDTSLWDTAFLEYDYIGAPWSDNVVGNGGFNIESRKLMELKQTMPMDSEDFHVASDRLICDVRKAWLEERGIRFAPVTLAMKFSTEQIGGEKPSFGFHGRLVSAHKYQKGWKMINSALVVESGGFTLVRNQAVPPIAKRKQINGMFLLPPKRTRKIAVLSGCLDNYMELGKHTIYENKQEYCKRHGYTLEVAREVRPKYQDQNSHAFGFSWSRLDHMLELLKSGKYEWVWTVGADTLITNMTLPLDTIIDVSETPEAESLHLQRCPRLFDSPAPPSVQTWRIPRDHKWNGKKHLLICGERVTSMQADSFLVKSSPQGIAYVEDILSCYPAYKHHAWVENQAMIDLRDKHAAITFMVPQWRLNSVDYRRWHWLRPYYRTGTDFWGNRGQWQKGDFMIHWPAASLEQRLKWLKEYSQHIIR